MPTLLETVKCPPIADAAVLFKSLETFREQGGKGDVYVRGQPDADWGLVPSIGRRRVYHYGPKVIEEFSLMQESDLLDRFRRYAYAIVGRELTLWETIFLARHHNLPVRLLDWTSNPLVALFFAVECHRFVEKDGAVWVIRRKADRKNDIRVLEGNGKPLDIKGVRMIYPVFASPRLVVQSGCFTIHGYPWMDLSRLDSHEHGQADMDIESLRKLTVPREYKMDLLKYLMRAGINSRTLFPDLDGLAKGLWQLEVIRD
jgi:hypothetical protein